MIMEYNLTTPYMSGEFEGGWCPTWAGYTGLGAVDRSVCFARCAEDEMCEQAVSEDSTVYGLQCFHGRNRMAVGSALGAERNFCANAGANCATACYAKGRAGAVSIREEKFVSADDAISTIIVTDAPVQILFEGRSYNGEMLPLDVRGTMVLNASCGISGGASSGLSLIHILEGGTIDAKVTETGSHTSGHGGEYVPHACAISRMHAHV